MRFYAPLKLSENILQTPEGFLLCLNVPIARTGEMKYGRGETPIEVGPDGFVTIVRSSEDVFSKETIASFEGKPLTIGHPSEDVTPMNWSRLARGHIQNVRRGEGEFEGSLVSDILVTDAEAIERIKAKNMREVSCGYEAEYTETGIGMGTQKNIIGNHLALVEEGRAGPSYAINDHKKRGKHMGLGEKFKAMFSKVADEAAKAADEFEQETKEKSKDSGGYDELVQICKDLGEKIEAMGKSKDAPKEEVKEDKKDDPKDAEVSSSLEDRLKKLEELVAKVMSQEAGDEEPEEANDEEPEMTGDTKSRAEILAPGIKASKDVMKKALEAAYDTKEGKAVIDALTDGKPTYDSAEKVKTLFIAASEVLKSSRGKELVKTKTSDYRSSYSSDGVMTAEKMNELNAQRYASK